MMIMRWESNCNERLQDVDPVSDKMFSKITPRLNITAEDVY